MIPNLHSANAYEILGLPSVADRAALRMAFRKLAMKYHPDTVPPAEKEKAARLFARVNQAYELLRDPARRRKYDSLLQRGIIPDMGEEVGNLPLPRLAEIFGRIQALNFEALPLKLPGEDAELLTSSLIDVEEFRESILDCIAIRAMRVRGFEVPPEKEILEQMAEPGFQVKSSGHASFNHGVLVVTETRLIVLMSFDHFYKLVPKNTLFPNLGEKAMRVTLQRLRSFSFLSLKTLEIREVGRAARTCSLVLEDEDGVCFTLTLKKPHLTRLFLVANTYRLPLRARNESSLFAECRRALMLSLSPIFAWFSPFLPNLLMVLMFTVLSLPMRLFIHKPAESDVLQYEDTGSLESMRLITHKPAESGPLIIPVKPVEGEMAREDYRRSLPIEQISDEFWNKTSIDEQKLFLLALELMRRKHLAELAWGTSLVMGVVFSTRLYRTWRTGQAQEILGELPMDSGDEAPSAPFESEAAVQQIQIKTTPDEVPDTPAAQGDSAYDQFVRQRSEVIAPTPQRKESPPPHQEPSAPPVSKGPADVEMPEAVREALRREKPPE